MPLSSNLPFKDILGIGAVGYGLLMAARGVSGLVGGLLIGRLSKLAQPYRLLFICSVLIGGLFFLVFNFPFLPLAVVILSVMGIPGVAVMVTSQTLLQQNTAEEFRGRVFGTLNTTSSLLMLTGLILASSFGDAVGIIPVLNLASSVYLVAALVALLAMRRQVIASYKQTKI